MFQYLFLRVIFSNLRIKKNNVRMHIRLFLNVFLGMKACVDGYFFVTVKEVAIKTLNVGEAIKQ